MNMNKAHARNGWIRLFRALTIVSMIPAAGAAFGATIAVTADAPDVLDGADGACALREAIQNVNDGAATYADCANSGAAYGTSDTITLPAGTYTNAIAKVVYGELLNANGSLDILANLTVTGAGASTTFIDGGAIDLVLYVGAAVSISGVTIRNGSGGIYSLGTLTVDSVIITGNTGGGYGGIRCEGGGGATITNSTISGNGATHSAGGVFCLGSPLTITNSTISGNTSLQTSAGGGVGIGLVGSSLTITGSTISGNTTNSAAGGVGIVSNAGAATITNTTISGNTAVIPTFGGTIVGGNSGGGGVYVSDATTVLTLVNTTITDNSGGGILTSYGTVNLTNSIVAGQASGADCTIWDNGTFGTGFINSNDYNLDSDNTCGLGGAHDLPGSSLANLGALANNGGSTQTHALLSGSAALDAGDCNGGAVTVGQRGISRPQGAACDIGALEVKQYTLDISVTGSGTMADNGALAYFSIDCGATCSDLLLEGDTATFTVTPTGGYAIQSVTGCGGSMVDANTYATGTVTADCTVSAIFAATPVDGACGSDDGNTLSATPTNLCNAGTPSSVSGSGPWSWSCYGANGGSDAACSANLQTVPSGDLDADNDVDMNDVNEALRMAAGIDLVSSSTLATGDVAPLVGGVPLSDGVIDIGDVVVILRKAKGLVTW